MPGERPELAACKRPESVLVLVHDRAGQVLLLERTRPAGWWQSVTGSLEWGESPRQAALRELREETGIEADPATLVDCRQTRRYPIHPDWRDRYAPEVRENLEHWFRLPLPAPVSVRLNPAEHRRYLWLPAAQAARRVASWTNREAIERCLVDGEA